MRPSLKPWLPVLLWMGFIFVMSTSVGGADHTSRIIEPLLRWLFPHLAAENIELLHHGVRKAAHFTEYAVLALLLQRALLRSRPDYRGPAGRVYTIAFSLAVIYATTDEFHQRFVAGRTSSARDVLVDATGAGVALGVAALAKNWRPRRDSNTRRPV